MAVDPMSPTPESFLVTRLSGITVPFLASAITAVSLAAAPSIEIEHAT